MRPRFVTAFALFFTVVLTHTAEASPSVGDHITIYQDADFYSSFPSIVRRPNGDLLVAFRRAPDRRRFGEKVSHTDANSYLVTLRSKDRGRTWTKEPKLLFAHPFGGSQDPCMVQLRDGTILCSSYAWAPVTDAARQKLTTPFSSQGAFVFLGGFWLRSKDGGTTWEKPILPPPCAGEANRDLFGKLLPAYNRGAMCEGRDGTLYWVVASNTTNDARRTSNHLLISRDKGSRWQYSSVVAQDAKISFNEASIYETPKGDLVAFLRTAGFDDHTCVARSTDHGKSFRWEDAGFQGHPHHALRLPDNRVLLVYGYRHAPFGIRARILDPECANPADAPEFILRSDGGNSDLGYPWATMVSRDQVLVVYYFNKADGTRHIDGTFLDLSK